MKLRRNPNYNMLIARLQDLNDQSTALQNNFKEVMTLLDNVKLGIQEVDYKLDDDLQRFKGTFNKIEDLLRTL